MRLIYRMVLFVTMLGLLAVAAPAQARVASQPVPGGCQTGVLPAGALWKICVPAQGWNGDLVLWSHGYVAPDQPLDFYNEALDDGTSLPELVQGLGYAYAASSYRVNGLAVLPGVEDNRELIAQFRRLVGVPRYTYATGASEGGLVTTLLVEQSPQLVSGGLAVCGPIGSFRGQVDYWGDFRVLFDYFFPGVIPGSPVAIPQDVLDHWDTVYAPAVRAAVAANPNAARQLISTSRAAIDPNNPASVVETAVDVLWYNIFATNDAQQKLGGNPYGNARRIYIGSDDDAALNRGVQRFSADPQALANLGLYETTGRLARPLVLAHTTGDPVVPFWQEVLYFAKARPKLRVTPIPIERYGHCTFTRDEIVTAFSLLVFRVTGRRG